jgi:hypothetical protein
VSPYPAKINGFACFVAEPMSDSKMSLTSTLNKARLKAVSVTSAEALGDEHRTERRRGPAIVSNTDVEPASSGLADTLSGSVRRRVEGLNIERPLIQLPAGVHLVRLATHVR